MCEAHASAELEMTEPDVTETDDEALAPPAPTDDVPDRESLSRALRSLKDSEARVERNAQGVYDEARSKLVLELLPVLDNLDRTLRAYGASVQVPLVEGVRMIRTQLEGVLLRYGVEHVDATGHKFDPALHEAISAIPVGDPSRVGMVIEQLEPGYRFGARLLRAAKVTVGVMSGVRH
jgi:molecular chaperone GrpE